MEKSRTAAFAKPKLDLTGRVFGKLKVICGEGTRPSRGKKLINFSYWECVCECGKKKIAKGVSLTSGRVSSCMSCSRQRFLKNVGKDEVSFRALYRAYQNRAEAIGVAFEISPEKFRELTQRPCYYCDKPPISAARRTLKNAPYLYNGLDRLNREGGYTQNNIVTCCKQCNYSKHVQSWQEFMECAKRIYEKHGLENGIPKKVVYRY